jgi:hypothetical protein
MRPKVGVLARVKSKFNDKDVYLGPADGSDGYNEMQPRIPVGTHVFIVKTIKIEEDNIRHPLVTSEYGIGWLYWDELERLDEVQPG